MATRILRPFAIRPDFAIRIGVGLVLVLAGLSKLFAPEATAMVIEGHGIPDGLALGVIAGVCETCAGALILLGWFAQNVAFASLLFYPPLAFLLHFTRPLDLGFDVILIAGLWYVATRRKS